MSTIKMCVVGSSCGKTSLCIRLIQNEFIVGEDPTIQTFYSVKVSKIDPNNQKFKDSNLVIMDTSGSDVYYDLHHEWFSWGDAFLLVYSVGDVNSFDCVSYFYQSIQRAKGSKEFPLVLCATQCDLSEDQRKVLSVEGRSLAYYYKCPFIEVSSKTGLNVTEAFKLLIQQYLSFQSRLTIPPQTKTKKKPHNVTVTHFEAEASSTPCEREGTLALKVSSMKGWTTRFLQIKDGMFTIFKSDVEKHQPIESFPLLTCSVKVLDTNCQSFRFQVITPQKSFIFKASNIDVLNSWVNTLQLAILNALNETTGERKMKSNLSSSEGVNSNSIVTGQKALDILREVPDNSICADCGHNYADWAVINIGAVICIQCSGIHRSLGATVSKVRSITLDEWDEPLLNMMKAIGNKGVNSFFEWETNVQKFKPSSTAPRTEKEKYIYAKYVNKLFINQNVSVNDDAVVKAVLGGPNSFPDLIHFIFAGYNVNSSVVYSPIASSSQPTKQIRTTLLHLASTVPNNTNTIEFLLKNGAEINMHDSEGKTPLEWAESVTNNEATIKLLTMRGATKSQPPSSNSRITLSSFPQHTEDSSETPLSSLPEKSKFEKEEKDHATLQENPKQTSRTEKKVTFNLDSEESRTPTSSQPKNSLHGRPSLSSSTKRNITEAFNIRNVISSSKVTSQNTVSFETKDERVWSSENKETIASKKDDELQIISPQKNERSDRTIQHTESPSTPESFVMNSTETDQNTSGPQSKTTTNLPFDRSSRLPSPNVTTLSTRTQRLHPQPENNAVNIRQSKLLQYPASNPQNVVQSQVPTPLTGSQTPPQERIVSAHFGKIQTNDSIENLTVANSKENQTVPPTSYFRNVSSPKLPPPVPPRKTKPARISSMTQNLNNL